MIRISRIRNSAVWSDGNPGILQVLEAELLRKKKKVD
jgi:hypothetical protein